MAGDTLEPQRFADLLTSPAYPTWAKPEPADAPTKHLRTYTLLRAIAAAWDRVVSAAVSAAYDHGSQTCSADALDFVGETYGGLARALIDSDASYRAYLRHPLARWYTFGTRGGLLAELAHIGYPRAQVVTWRDLVDAGAGSPNVVFGGITTFFFVAIFAPSVITARLAKWKVSGDRWKDTKAVWGGSANRAQYLDEIRRVIAMVKPAHTSCRFVVVFNDTASGLNAQLLPTGSYVVYPFNEQWERVRPAYAYNVFYTSSPLVP